MKTLLRIIFLLAPVFAFGQAPDLQNISMLASQYYQSKEFGKAAEMYGQLYASTKAEGYFSIYLDCLLGIPDYEKAEKEIRKGLRGNSSDKKHWGRIQNPQNCMIRRWMRPEIICLNIPVWPTSL
jgi:hypothetical protein